MGKNAILAATDVSVTIQNRKGVGLTTAKERGLVWSLELAQRAIGYFEEVLRLNGGQFEGKPFVVLPWQAFIIGSLFGWLGADGYRRFRTCYTETAKGSGKSPLAGGVGLYGLTSDGEPRAEIYAAATKKDQAQILFRDAVAMVEGRERAAVKAEILESISLSIARSAAKAVLRRRRQKAVAEQYM